MDGSGQQGLRFIEPAYPPILYNNTIAHNKSEGIYFEDNSDIDGDPNQLDYPEVQNCILYYNNMAAETPVQVTGINRSYVYHSCIYDPNDPNGLNATPDVNYNFSANPKLAYYDPNNVHLAYDSPCKDAGNPYFSADEVGWYDMDSEERLIGSAVDIGADELYSCDGDYTEDDFSNTFDRNADGAVNYHEFAAFSRAWLSRDPNDPAISDPNLFDPNDFIGWNPQCDLNGDYQVTLPDIVMFMDDAPWLWEACWRDNYLAVYGMTSGGESLLMMQPLSMVTMEAQIIESEPEPSLETLVQIVGFLDEIAAESSDNLENIQELRATLMDEITAIWNQQNE